MSEQVINQHGEVTDVTTAGPTMPAEVDPAQFADVEKRLAEIQDIDPKGKPQAGILYWEAGNGDNIRGIFAGWQMITPKSNGDDAQPIPAAVVRISPYQCYMSAAVKFVNAFRSIPVGKAVFVECTGSKSGEAKDFRVRVLD